MNLPTKEQAHHFIDEASRLNPGPWIDHSKYVALAAENIATECPELNYERAYILGYLHDIGRREGVSEMHHMISGYNFLSDQGYTDAARVCITHTYTVKDLNACFSKNDCSPDEIQFLKDFLDSVEYDDYDRLIQLCDALALSTGFCLIEKRLINVALRYGINDLAVRKWKEIFHIRDHFETKIGKSIYELLPGVVENTFDRHGHFV